MFGIYHRMPSDESETEGGVFAFVEGFGAYG